VLFKNQCGNCFLQEFLQERRASSFSSFSRSGDKSATSRLLFQERRKKACVGYVNDDDAEHGTTWFWFVLSHWFWERQTWFVLTFRGTSGTQSCWFYVDGSKSDKELSQER